MGQVIANKDLALAGIAPSLLAAAGALVSVCLVLWPAYFSVSAIVLVGLVAFSWALLARFQYGLFFILALVAWFPEFSQTEWDVWTAEDAPSLYNYRPIPSFTASVFDYIFALIVIFWVVRYILPSPRRLLRVPLARLMLAFLGVCTLSLAYGLFRGNEQYYALREFRVSAYFVLVYLMVVTTCKQQWTLHGFVKLSLALAAAIGVYGVIRYVLGIGKEFADVKIVYYDIADSMVFYFVLLGMLSFALHGALRRSHRFPIILTAIPIFFSFIFSFRRGAWLAFAVGLLFLFLFGASETGKRSAARSRFLAVVLGSVLVLTGLVLADSSKLQFVQERLVSIFDVTEDPSNVFRILDAMNALRSFLAHPVFGVGFGGRYDLEFVSDVASMQFWENVNRTSHNGYLFILFKMGLVGFSVYMAIFFRFLMSWFRSVGRIRDAFHRALLSAVGAIFIAVLMNNVTNPVSDALRPALLFAFVMGLGALLMESPESVQGKLNRVQVNGRPGTHRGIAPLPATTNHAK